MKSLDLNLGGVHGEIDAVAFASALEDAVKLLRSVSDEDIDCTIGDLRIGSAHVAVLAPDESVDTLVDGLMMINTEGGMPPGFSNHSLEIIDRMGKVLSRRGVSSISLGKQNRMITFETRFLEQVRVAKRALRTSFGSIPGRLYSYSNRYGEAKASLEAFDTGRAVKLTLNRECDSQIEGFINRDVLAIGQLTRDPEDNRVVEVEVTQLKLTKRERLPGQLVSFRGSLAADWPDGLDPVEAVKRHREA